MRFDRSSSPWILLACLIATPAFASPSDTAAPRIATLRAMGPAGVQAFLDLAAAAPEQAAGPAYAAALDAVCAQHDCAASHLYWYTDLAAARAAARQSGKPILSLRLLGRLDEELSCANSRFFRSVLYPDPEISRLLRERFVLHWESVRPVPKVTVDFGDGRRLVGTITGNSIHYLLDPQGRLVDALPGLNGPAAFRRFLEAGAAEAARTAGLADGAYVRELAAFHKGRLAAAQAALARDFAAVGAEDPAQAAQLAVSSAMWGHPREVKAWKASERAMSKSAGEGRIVYALSPDADWATLTPEITPAGVAGLHRDEARLSPESRRLLLARAGSWMKVDDEDAAVARFEALIAEDTVRNEYMLHSALHSWLAASRTVPDLADFNERVYENLFFTPGSDPWLGLAPEELYAVLTPAR